MPDASGNLTADERALLSTVGNYNYYLNPTVAAGGRQGGYSTPRGGPRDFGAWGESGKVVGNLALPGLGGGIVNAAEGDFKNALLSFASGGFSDLLGMFGIGGDKDEGPKWNPYASGGMYYFDDPRVYNPVPLSNIPGTHMGPSHEYITMAQNVRALTDLLPFYSQAVSGQAIPAAQAQLAAEAATSGPRLALMAKLYKEYGPQLNQIGNDIARQNAFASAERDRDVLAGPGGELVKQALETAKLYDPEYFSTRALTGQRTNDLLNSIDLGSGLSATEMDSISKGLAREGAQRGMELGTPSNFDAISNATQYGEAGRAREVQNKNLLSQAIQASTQFLPAAKSGVDVFQVATGRSSTPNSGEGKFTGINQANNNAASMAEQMMNSQTNMWTTQQNNNLQRDLNEKDWADYLGQVTSSLGNLGGMAMMMCWVAREVYGADNPDWLKFRNWMFTKAPLWFFNLYLQVGERFAKFIKNKPTIKSLVRRWMDRRIK